MILALSTTTEVASIALATGDRIVQTRFESRRELARTLMSRIDRLCLDAGVGTGSLTAIAVDRGPGSFTGARIGVATARALASALGLAIRTETSLAPCAGPRTPRGAAPPAGARGRGIQGGRDVRHALQLAGRRGVHAHPLAFEDAPEFARRHAGALLVGAVANPPFPVAHQLERPRAGTGLPRCRHLPPATGELPPGAWSPSRSGLPAPGRRGPGAPPLASGRRVRPAPAQGRRGGYRRHGAAVLHHPWPRATWWPISAGAAN